MTPGFRKLGLTAHVVTSVGWLGAAVAYAGLLAAALRSNDASLVRGASLALGPMTWFVIVPLALTTLLTSLVQSLGTPVGLFRHYWVIFKLVLTLAATAVLLRNTRAVQGLVQLAASGTDIPLAALKGQLLHAALGALVLVATTVLAVYKPRGLTKYGWSKLYKG